jgi:hypothetical protein
MLTWEGLYNVTVTLASEFVAIENNLLKASVRCPVEKPWFCVDGKLAGSCVANSYKDCGYEEL